MTDISIGLVPPDDPDARSLMFALYDDLDVRYADAGPAPMTAAEFADGMVGKAAPPDGVFVLGRIDGEAVACGAVVPLRPEERVGEVRRMFVDVRARGLGLSRQVLARLEDEAAGLGYQRLQLETGLRQPEALGLYRSAGWAEITPYGLYADDPLSVCFAKEL